MVTSFTVKYRQPGQWFWRKIKNVTGDGLLERCRYFHTLNDSIIYISIGAEVVFDYERQKKIEQKMAEEAGQIIPRATVS